MKMPSRHALVLSHVAFEDLGSLEAPLRERGFEIESVLAAKARFPLPQAESCDLLIVLDLRYEAIDKVQAAIVQAINGPGGNAQIQDIAGDMGMIYASDILYKVRAAPLIEQALTNAGIQIGTGAVYGAAFLPDQSWTNAAP